METVQHLLDSKGHDVFSIHRDDSVFSAIQKMEDKNVGALVVIEDDDPVGMFTERDYARNIILKGKSSPITIVGDVMTSPVACVRPELTVKECMAVMTEKRVRHLPVLMDGKVTGIVSIGDLVKSVIADQKFTIEQLELYIRS